MTDTRKMSARGLAEETVFKYRAFCEPIVFSSWRSALKLGGNTTLGTAIYTSDTKPTDRYADLHNRVVVIEIESPKKLKDYSLQFIGLNKDKTRKGCPYYKSHRTVEVV